MSRPPRRSTERRPIARRSTRNGASKTPKPREHAFGPDLTILTTRLSNGLGVVMLVDRVAPIVSYQSWFRIGSRHEKPGKTGLAHLFEHLMFKGTKKYGPGQFDRLFELQGGEVNAATWTDWTCYYENVPKAALPLAIELEADRLSNLDLSKEQVLAERDVVANERRFSVDDDVGSKASETLYSTAFQRHPYRWPTIGWMADIEAFNLDDCERFYRTYYAPNNASVVVVGDFDAAATLERIEAAYGALPRSKIPRAVRVAEPEQRRERRKTIALATDTVKVTIGYRAVPYGTDEYAALSLLNEVLCGGRSSRLRWKLVTEQEVAAEVSGGVAPFAEGGLHDFFLDAREGRAASTLLRLFDKEIARVRNKRVPNDELEKAKSRVELAFLTSLETAGGKADQVGFDATVLDDPAAAFRTLERYRAVTSDDLLDVARRYLAPERRSIVIVEPNGAKE
jgi:zinc protease